MNHLDHAEVYSQSAESEMYVSKTVSMEKQLSDLRRYFEQVDARLAMLARIEMNATGNCELADRATDDLHEIAVRLFADAVVTDS